MKKIKSIKQLEAKKTSCSKDAANWQKLSNMTGGI